MERAATCVRCPVALEVLGEVSEVSAMRKIGQLQGQHTCRPYNRHGRAQAMVTKVGTSGQEASVCIV